MRGINIGDLKNNLSHYLRQVREGNEIVIKDRDQVIARIVPAVPSNNYDEDLAALAAQGKVRLPELLNAEIPRRRLPRLKTPGKAGEKIIRRIIDEERGRY